MALQMIPVIQKSIEIIYDVNFDYTTMNEVMMVVKQFNCTVIHQEMQLFCLLKIGVPKSRLEEVLYRFKDLHTVTIQRSK